jgi:hypothetical protein
VPLPDRAGARHPGRVSTVDARGRLEDEPFAFRITKDGRVLVSYQGRPVAAPGSAVVDELQGQAFVALLE